MKTKLLFGTLISLALSSSLALAANGFVERIPAGSTQSVSAEVTDVLVLRSVELEEDELTAIAVLKAYLLRKFGPASKDITYSINNKLKVLTYTTPNNVSVTVSFSDAIRGKFP